MDVGLCLRLNSACVSSATEPGHCTGAAQEANSHRISKERNPVLTAILVIRTSTHCRTVSRPAASISGLLVCVRGWNPLHPSTAYCELAASTKS